MPLNKYAQAYYDYAAGWLNVKEAPADWVQRLLPFRPRPAKNKIGENHAPEYETAEDTIARHFAAIGVSPGIHLGVVTSRPHDLVSLSDDADAYSPQSSHTEDNYVPAQRPARKLSHSG